MSLLHYSAQSSILFVDHSNNIEQLVRNGMLAYPCYMQFSPDSREKALELIKRDPPDLIVSSLQLSDGTGLDLVREMQLKVGKLPAILIANEIDNPQQSELKKEARRSGIFDLIEIPFDVQDLIRKMDRAVRATKAFRRQTRLESFVEYEKLHSESQSKGILISDLLGEALGENGLPKLN
jgi:DNA-binding NtrC family response regulator